MILCGVRDYRVRSSSEEIVLAGSAFNIKAESLGLGDCAEADVRELRGQQVEETGHEITDRAMAEVCALPRGQP